jgi:4-diphosphocytidyl-2-C-methyl-D-erythritol kinase
VLKLVSTLAPAKVNLFLRVTGRRPDGYHELDSIFAPIALCDRVALGLRPAAGP